MNNINEGKYTGREIILAGMVLFLTGALFGVFFSPKKHQVIGSNNSNNGSNNGPTTNHNQSDKENMENEEKQAEWQNALAEWVQEENTVTI